MKMSYTGNVKQVARSYTVTPGRKYRYAILLPGEKCLDVKFYLDQGYMDAGTRITVVERTPSTMDAIKREFTKMPFTNVRFCPPGLVEDTPDFGPYDFVNIDTCSTPNPEMFDWLRRQRIVDGGEVNFWLTGYRSQEEFKQLLAERMLRTPAGRTLMEEYRNKILHLDNQVPTPLKSVVKFTTPLVTGSGLYAALNNYDCVPKSIVSYTAHQATMYIYRFTNMVHLDRPKPLVSFVKEQDETIEIYRPETWDSRDYKGNAQKTTIELCLQAVQSGGSVKGYANKRVKAMLQEGMALDKIPVQIKAGLKSAITKWCSKNNIDSAACRMAHSFVDGV